ncbi:MAG: sigma-70 family RNA polymerase sigma factor [Candidatus Sumerlaeia bacterium]|nr:sigma-70 family RNA polymerase sigma factor [Candidatus Sumerlaeia bacterium]
MTEYMDNDAGLYMDEVQSECVLTREQEVALFQRLERGDAEAREEIVRANLRFVVKIAYEFVNRGLPLADLIQEGNVGLLEVIPKYDWRKGFRFSTYAAFWIRQAIQMALRQHASLIRLPVRKSRMLGRLNREMQQLRQEIGREPTSYELAERMDTTVEEVERLMMLREGVLSLDAQENEDDAPLLETMADDEALSPREIAAGKQIRGKVARVLDYLGERERRIVRLRFGFESGRTLSLRKTSKLVGLSQEGVRRIEQRALDKLRRPALQKMVAGLI